MKNEGNKNRLSQRASSIRRPIVFADLLTLLSVSIVVYLCNYGFEPSVFSLGFQPAKLNVFVTALPVCIVIIWFLLLAGGGSQAESILGSGPEEYRLVMKATATSFTIFISLFFVLDASVSRIYVFSTFAAGLFCLLIVRHQFRSAISRKRASGKLLRQAVLIGEGESVLHVLNELIGVPETGLKPVGIGTLDGDITEKHKLPWLPLHSLAQTDSILGFLDQVGAESVIICSSQPQISEDLKKLAWALEDRNIAIYIVPGLVDVVGPRIHMRSLVGIQLLEIAVPRFTGIAHVFKRGFDFLLSILLIITLAPVFVIVWLLLRVSSTDSPIFTQLRAGISGTPFKIYKFRTMKQDGASNRELRAMQINEGNEVLFKLKDDPRITTIGRFLRKWSMDELPQLFNVLRGDMSIVGPRPPLLEEVDLYEQHVHRRLLVKPGITGLWQVSGRSNLSWEESVRLDLYYVENWSPTMDFAILLRTVRVVLTHEGAY